MVIDLRHHLGRVGERLAREHLERLGYRVVEGNYRTRFGELDLIVCDATWLVFVEVKTRRAGAMESAVQAVSPTKQRRVRAMAAAWLVEASERPRSRELRFDVRLDKHARAALSFEALRHEVMAVAQEGVKLQRFKGLGEMNADQLFDTAMDPGRRTLQQVTVDDAESTDQIFSMLMGDKVEPRREFIEAHARDASLDI